MVVATVTRVASGPGVWTAAELHDETAYVRPITADELEDIDDALAAATSVPADKLVPEPLPPALAGLVEDVRDRVESGLGYVVLRGLQVGSRYPPEEAAKLHWLLGAHLGEVVPQSARGERVRILADPRHPDQPSGMYASKAGAPFHTDPVDITSYLCFAPARSGGDRVVASGPHLYNTVAREHPEWLELVHRGYATDWVGEQPVGQPGWYRAPIFSWAGDVLSCSLATKRIVSAMRFPDVPRLGPDEMSCVMYLDSLLRRTGTALHVALGSGDIELVDNHRVVHARTGFVDDPVDESHRRRLQRLWVSRSAAGRTTSGPRTSGRTGARCASPTPEAMPCHE